MSDKSNFADMNQERHELERQRYKLQKELVVYRELGEKIQLIDKRARQGDADAIRQFRQLEDLANSELGMQMKALAQQLDELHGKYSRLMRLQGSVKKGKDKPAAQESEEQGKQKKKRRNRIKYL